MNILMVTPYFYEPPGGKYGVMRLSIELNKHGHNVYVISSKVRNAKAYEEFEGVKVFRKKPLFYIPSLPYAATFMISDIFRYIKLFNIDVLHVHTIHYFSSFSAAIISKMTNFPYILSVLGMTTTFARDFVDTVFKIYESTISKFVIAQASLIIAIAKQLVPRALQLGAPQAKIKVIPHGIDPIKFSLNNSGSKIRDKFGIEEDDNVIGFVGRLVPLKGIKYLLDAIKIINKKNDNVKVLIVGDGPQKRELELLVRKNLKQNVIFTGFISKENLPHVYPAFDIFTLPSLTEGLSNTLLEAMACGIPIVTTNVGGNRELVEHGKTGLLVQPKSSAELAEQIFDLLNNSKKRLQMGKRGRDKILSHYTWEKIVPMYEAAYEQILNRSN